MILYRKSGPLRVRHASRPEPPFWYATAVAPYGGRRAEPVAIEYLELSASSAERSEVTVCDDVRLHLERTARLPEPLMIDAAEVAESIFRRGEETLHYCAENGVRPLHLVSTASALPQLNVPGAVLAIAAWPFDLDRLEPMFEEAAALGWTWGVAIPILYPISTDLLSLGKLTQSAAKNGASFVTGISIEADPTARSAIAKSVAVDAEGETWEMLFHADLEPIVVATERHIAALAAASGMDDFIVPPRWEEKSNWNAAILLTLTAARMIAMEHDLELAGTLVRSAGVVAALEKPLVRIAAAASLSIVEALDEVSVDVLTDWLDGRRPPFVEKIDREWRLRRDAGM